MQGNNGPIVYANVDTARAKHVLKEALEVHIGGLEEGIKGATEDRTIESPEELVDVTREMDDDLEVSKKLLEALNDGS